MLLARYRSLLLSLSLFVPALPIHAQSADTSGLEVYVHDPSGALIPGATLTLEQADTHIAHMATADAAGHFRFVDLPVGAYTLSIAKPGFEAYRQTGLNLLVGQVPILQISLPLGNESVHVDVNADVPIIDTQRTAIGQNISQMEIENLPSDGRNFLDFALTVPGATSQATGGQGSGVVFNGQRSRSNNILIDGVENNGQLNGTVRQTLSIDAISQFQVMTAQFQPEYGNAGGGVVNILTKSGTNSIHGDAFYFARRAWMNAQPIFFAANPPFTPLYVQNDFGATLGGPIKKDKTFFFASAEYIGFNTNQASSITPSEAAEINADLIAHPLAGNTVQVGSSTINVATATTTASMRLDHTFNAKDSLYFRFLYGQYNRSNPSTDANDGLLSDFSNFGFDTLKAAGTTLVETHIFTPTMVNEARFQYAPQFLTQHPNSFGPDVTIAGVAQFGQNLSFPTVLNESHYEWYDALTISRPKHQIKLGADVVWVRGYSSYPTNFSGYFYFSGLNKTQSANYNFDAGQPYSFTQSFGNPSIQLPDWLNSGFVQDSWKINSRLTLNYGLRYDIDLQPQGYNGNLSNPIQAPLPKGIPRDYNNLSPRLGLAWSVDKAGKTVVRAGYGFFYDKIFLLVARNALLPVETYYLYSPLVTGPQATELRNLYTNGIYSNTTVYPNDPLALTAPSINSIPKSLPIPYAQESNLTIDREISTNWALELSYIHLDATDGLKSTNTNLNPPTIVTAANAAAITGSATPSYQQLLRPFYPTVHPNPAYTNIEQVGSNGHSRYDGFVGSVIHRATRNLTLRGNWTWSKTIDDGTDFTQAQQPDNPLVPHAERSISLEDQRNRFAASAVYDLPTLSGSAHSVKVLLLSNWISSTTAIVNSGTPVNAVVGSDVNGDGSTTDRPYYPGAPGVVMRRNFIRGPRSQNVSLRLQKAIPIHDAMRLSLSFEAFNLFNHTNYSSSGIYPYWGTAATPGAGYGAPRTAGATRHLQMGAKFYF